jgi:cation diffusion facilitator CzcD-associated flavoprotein CzcO
MYTMGYSFAPWLDRKMLADGETILSYIKKTADDFDIRRNVRLRHWVSGLSWEDSTNRWTLTIKRTYANGDADDVVQMTCQFIFMCTGYYDYDHGYEPSFPGSERYKGSSL